MNWPITRRLAGSWTPFLLLLWVGFAVVAVGVAFGISIWGEVTGSVWHRMSVAVPRWLALGLGFHLVRYVLPMSVAHGRTRAEFLAQAGACSVLFTAVMAALIAAGYGLESLLYRAAGWPHAVDGEQLFGSATDFGAISTAYWLVFSVWLVAGALIAGGFDRWGANGFPVLVPGVLLLLASGFAVGGVSALPFLDALPLFGAFSWSDKGPVVLSVVLPLAAYAIGVVSTWMVVRDMPIRIRDL